MANDEITPQNNTDELQLIETEESIIEVLDRIQAQAKNSGLTPLFWSSLALDFRFLREKLRFSDGQLLLIAVMAEIGDAVSWRKLGEFLGVSRLKAMALTPDMNALRRARWVFSAVSHEFGARYVGFKLSFGVITALRNNTVFVPKSIENLSEQIFFTRLTSYVYEEGADSDIPFDEKRDYLLDLINANQHLPICKKASELIDDLSRVALMMMFADYVRCRGEEHAGLSVDDFAEWMDSDMDYEYFAAEMRSGNHELFRENIIENAFDEGMVDTERVQLTPSAIESLMPKYKFRRRRGKNLYDSDTIKPEAISPKTLYYNPAEKESIDRLASLFVPKTLDQVQNRLKEKGMRPGITCLFYGAPGTGKTETALQLARLSGRNIMQVDIAAMRDKYVGESEKTIKGVFERYRSLCKLSETLPILLFNEADAIIGRRFETTNSSVEKMDNAMQNIILQELENFQGILIATTNLTGNLDKAFDRRFLFKVEFKRPSLESKIKIWHSMLPEIDETTASKLAEEFDFSGGQIENIVRKSHIEYALSGEKPTLSRLRQFCADEALNRSSRAPIGF